MQKIDRILFWRIEKWTFLKCPLSDPGEKNLRKIYFFHETIMKFYGLPLKNRSTFL